MNHRLGPDPGHTVAIIVSSVIAYRLQTSDRSPYRCILMQGISHLAVPCRVPAETRRLSWAPQPEPSSNEILMGSATDLGRQQLVPVCDAHTNNSPRVARFSLRAHARPDVCARVRNLPTRPWHFAEWTERRVPCCWFFLNRLQLKLCAYSYKS